MRLRNTKKQIRLLGCHLVNVDIHVLVLLIGTSNHVHFISGEYLRIDRCSNQDGICCLLRSNQERIIIQLCFIVRETLEEIVQPTSKRRFCLSIIAYLCFLNQFQDCRKASSTVQSLCSATFDAFTRESIKEQVFIFFQNIINQCRHECFF